MKEKVVWEYSSPSPFIHGFSSSGVEEYSGAVLHHRSIFDYCYFLFQPGHFQGNTFDIVSAFQVRKLFLFNFISSLNCLWLIDFSSFYFALLLNKGKLCRAKVLY